MLERKKEFSERIIDIIPKEILYFLENLNIEVYLGGSTVHDTLLGIPVTPETHDLDFTLIGLPPHLIYLDLSRRENVTDLSYESKHGLIKFNYKRFSIDLVCFKQGDIKKICAHHICSIKALKVQISPIHDIIDFHNGLTDIQTHTLNLISSQDKSKARSELENDPARLLKLLKMIIVGKKHGILWTYDELTLCAIYFTSENWYSAILVRTNIEHEKKALQKRMFTLLFQFLTSNHLINTIATLCELDIAQHFFEVFKIAKDLKLDVEKTIIPIFLQFRKFLELKLPYKNTHTLFGCLLLAPICFYDFFSETLEQTPTKIDISKYILSAKKKQKMFPFLAEDSQIKTILIFMLHGVLNKNVLSLSKEIFDLLPRPKHSPEMFEAFTKFLNLLIDLGSNIRQQLPKLKLVPIKPIEKPQNSIEVSSSERMLTPTKKSIKTNRGYNLKYHKNPEQDEDGAKTFPTLFSGTPLSETKTPMQALRAQKETTHALSHKREKPLPKKSYEKKSKSEKERERKLELYNTLLARIQRKTIAFTIIFLILTFLLDDDDQTNTPHVMAKGIKIFLMSLIGTFISESVIISLEGDIRPSYLKNSTRNQAQKAVFATRVYSDRAEEATSLSSQELSM